MHFAYFESLSLRNDDKVLITDRSGNTMEGYYKGNYIRQEFRFNFLEVKPEDKMKEISLSEIESMKKLN
jgi:hypothetical protein